MTRTQRVWMAVVLGAFSAAALADGMIVPVRPEVRVRGHWAVKYHHVRITVRDQVASVAIDQEFVNTGRGMIEVEYLFPVPPDAAIDSMTLIVDGREYAAKLLKADEARRIYESIVRQKKDPALLEYAGFGLYKTRAFPLQPGKPCKVVTTYKNICKRDRDLVEVWYPLNTEKFSAKAIDSVEVSVDIKSKADITAVYSPTHDLNVERKSAQHVLATYKAKKTLPTTDFQVYYKAADEKVGAVLLTNQPDAKQDGYFMMLVSPNPRSAKKNVVPKDVVVVFDHSGSMSGEKIVQAKEALRFILNNLNKEDRFNVIAYNDTVEAFNDKLEPANKPKTEAALERLDRIEATGGTNIHEALLTAVRGFGGRKGKRPAYVIFLTDGRPTVGNTNEADILAQTKKENAARARVFAFGVGYDVNVRLLDKLVRENHGKSDYVKPKQPIESKVSSLYAKIKNPVMTSLKVDLQGVRLRDVYPREMGDLFDGDQLVVVGRYDCKDVTRLSAAGGKRHTTLVVKGRYEGKERAFEYPVTIRADGKDPTYSFVEKLWAMRRVGFLLDQIQLHGKSQEVIDELVRLSMKYGIMTPYTSFLADERTKLADARAVRTGARRAAEGLSMADSGEAGQRGAMNRQLLNEARRAPAPSAPAGKYGSAVPSIGWGRKDSYEKAEEEVVGGVRQVGDQTLYRRRNVWRTARVAQNGLDKDESKVQSVQRFSREYFELVRRNTVAENQILASQRDDEELIVELRGQVYRIR